MQYLLVNKTHTKEKKIVSSFKKKSYENDLVKQPFIVFY